MKNIQEKWPKDSQEWCEPGETPNSIKFYQIYFLRHYNYTEDLFPYMEAFTSDTGSPLSFFIAANQIESDQCEAFC